MGNEALIIGGGAAGLLAACILSGAGHSVVLAEKQPRVGRKLLSTGNGRCNLTNDGASMKDYHGDTSFAGSVIAACPPEMIRRVFLQLGVPTRADEAGRVYPMSGQAASVLDALRLYAEESGCDIRTDHAVTSLRREKHGFIADTQQGMLRGERVLICAGGPAAPKLGGCMDGIRLLEGQGHRSVPCRPALAGLKVASELVRSLKGQRAQGLFTLLIDGSPSRAERGEIIFGDAGISGIAAMQLSCDAGDALRRRRRVELSACLMGADEAERLLEQRCELSPERALEDLLSGLTGKRVGMALLKGAGIGPLSRNAGSLTRQERRGIATVLSDWRFPICGVQGLEYAQVTAGGILTEDFDRRTMESRLVRGLYAAGEVLNVHGDCGGFNLQWAWASAITAAKDIMKQAGGNRYAGLSL